MFQYPAKNKKKPTEILHFKQDDTTRMITLNEFVTLKLSSSNTFPKQMEFQFYIARPKIIP